MKVTPTAFPEVLIIEPALFDDERGIFFESYNERRLQDTLGRELQFVQDNHSRSRKNVLRGLHFQRPPHGQDKLVRVVAGAVFDVAVDVRRSSPTFGKWTGVLLSAENHRQLWIPQGFAHGFVTLSESADVLYKASDYYSPALEGAVVWNDPKIAVEWPTDDDPILSSKDAAAPGLEEALTYP